MDIIGASLLAICIGLIVYKLFLDESRHWKRIGVKYVRPTIPYLSEMYNLLTKPPNELVLEQRKKHGKIYGVSRMGRRRLVIADPEVVRQICIRDFDYFPNHEVSSWTNDYQKNSLVWIKDDRWKRVRAMMSPTFTSGKIKRMFKLMDECANDLVDNLSAQCEKAKLSASQCQVDLVKAYGMYTMDGIATCCYGIKLRREQEDVGKNPSDPSHASRESFAEIAGKMLQWSRLRVLFMTLMPTPILELMRFKVIPNADLKPLADRVQKMIDMRREQRQSKYDDLLQLLVDARLDDELELSELDQKENHHAGLTHESLVGDQNRLKASVASQAGKQVTKTKLSDLEILCEAMLLLAAGLDTTRSSLSTITYFLAHNPEVQEKLYREVQAIAQYSPTADGKKVVFFNYESLTSCEYLDAVISEGLRRFSPVVTTTREAKKDYFIEKYNVHVPKGMHVNLGMYAMHMDPELWKEPEKFNPDRFMPGQKEKIVPGSYAPFSMGPRHCVGMRFSLTETKLGLAKAVINFKFEPAPGTQYPPVAVKAIGMMTVNDCRTIITPRGCCE